MDSKKVCQTKFWTVYIIFGPRYLTNRMLDDKEVLLNYDHDGNEVIFAFWSVWYVDLFFGQYSFKMFCENKRNDLFILNDHVFWWSCTEIFNKKKVRTHHFKSVIT